MPFATALTERLGLTHPIIQAPLAGGADSPDLIAAVGEAGALGCLGATYLTPAQIRETTAAIRDRTRRPFGINLFAPAAQPVPPNDMRAAVARVAPYYAELGLPPPPAPTATANPFPELFAAALESGARVFSFTSGLLPDDAVAAAKARGMFLIGTATTPEEAKALERSGVDAVVTQGAEAGGHRATFSGAPETGLIGSMALVPQVADAVTVPVIASGGIMDGRGLAAALALGASGVQMGTAFLASAESGAPQAYKQAIYGARAGDVRLTRAFSGRPARCIANRFTTEMEAAEAGAILPFPWQNNLTKALRAEAAKQNRAEFLSLMAGQGAALARGEGAAALIERLDTEATLALNRPLRR